MAECDIADWERYENNKDLLTDELIQQLKEENKVAELKLLLIFKDDILKAGNKLARDLNHKLGRPNNGPEVEWLEYIEKRLIRCYRTNFRLDYWDEQGMRDDEGGSYNG